jgi:hypothetical protein
MIGYQIQRSYFQKLIFSHLVIPVLAAFRHGGFIAPGHVPLVQPVYKDPTVGGDVHGKVNDSGQGVKLRSDVPSTAADHK